MLRLIHNTLPAVRRAVPAILVLVHVALAAAAGVVVLVTFGSAHRGFRHDFFGGQTTHRCPAARRWDHVAGAAAAGAVFGSVGFAGDALAHDGAIDVDGVGVLADVAGAC